MKHNQVTFSILKFRIHEKKIEKKLWYLYYMSEVKRIVNKNVSEKARHSLQQRAKQNENNRLIKLEEVFLFRRFLV